MTNCMKKSTNGRFSKTNKAAKLEYQRKIANFGPI